MNKDTFEHEINTNTKHPGNFFTGLVLGSLAGAATMLLFAPHSGKETRQQIQQKAMQLREQTTATVGNAVAQARVKTDEIKANITVKAKDLKKQGQDVLVDQLDRVSAAAKNSKKVIQGKDS